MIDGFGREIDYMRISVTDCCNLRCRYCMPNGMRLTERADILSYGELLRVCAAAVDLGITKFKITGGEPLARAGCAEFIRALKALPGAEQVTLTTNGLLLAPHLEELREAGIDGINISLDTTDDAQYRRLTGYGGDGATELLALAERCAAEGIRTKINAVLLAETAGEITELAAIAETLPIDVRFIELMPIGAGAGVRGYDPDMALRELRARWPDLAPTDERRGNGPARYWKSARLIGRIGFIDAVSHKFCESCNRVRLTSEGLLKPCLCYGAGTDLRALLRGGADDAKLRAALAEGIKNKPAAHCFSDREKITERRGMSEIGG